MTTEEILEYFYTNSANLGIERICFILLAGVLISALICLVYYVTGKGSMFNGKFCTSLIALTLISVVIMLMISSNVVISLGMVGALSIIRFRTAIKDARDTVFIFWAIAEGLSIGSQNFKLALVSTLFIGIVMILMSFMPFEKGNYLVIVRGGEEPIDIAMVTNVLSTYSKNVKIRSVNQDTTHREMIFQVRAKKKEIDPSFMQSLSEISGVKSINWVVESGENVG